jgi:hypothetical protein
MDSDPPLRPRELVPLLAMAAHPKASVTWTQAKLALVSGQTASQVNETLRRAAKAHLYSPRTKSIQRRHLLDFLRYGARHVFFAEPGPLVEGVPTGAACPAFSQLFAAPEQPLVWESDEGRSFGPAVEPLHAGVPAAALKDERLYAFLAAVDCMRLGGARERALASEFLATQLLDRSDHIAFARRELDA